jgi:hypothetical protein
MGSTNLLALVGMALFFLKFYLYIGLKFAINFVQHHCEKLLHGSSKTVICPFKNTHEDVFRTFCNNSIHSE